MASAASLTGDTIRLRGHHLGCVAVSMRTGDESHPTVPLACAWLRAHPHGNVQVVVGPDDICLPCPQWTGATCGRGFETLNVGKDKRFLVMLGMNDGDQMDARALFARLSQRATAAFFAEVCSGCSPDKCAAAMKAPALV